MWGLFKRHKAIAVKLALAEDSVVLRDERTSSMSRRLSARLTADGDLIVDGQDLGAPVRSYFGANEYEWSWTIRKQHLRALLAALGANSDVLAALKARFAPDRGDEIGTFLKDNAIPCEFWSRVGD